MLLLPMGLDVEKITTDQPERRGRQNDVPNYGIHQREPVCLGKEIYGLQNLCAPVEEENKATKYAANDFESTVVRSNSMTQSATRRFVPAVARQFGNL